MISRQARLNVFAIILAAALPTGCDGTPPPPLVMRISLPPWPRNIDDITAGLYAGTLSLDDSRLQGDLATGACTFVADSGGTSAIQVVTGGTPGDPKFNAEFVATGLQPAASTHPCSPDVTPVLVKLQPPVGLLLGQLTRGGSAELDVVDQVFTAAHGYVEFTLSTFDASTSTGSFRMIVRNDTHPDDTRTIYVIGNFTATPKPHS